MGDDNNNLPGAAMHSESLTGVASKEEATGLEVAISDIWPMLALCTQSGISLPDILTKLELPQDLLDEPDGYVLMVDYFRIVGEIALAFYDETCHLSDRPLILGTNKFVLDNLVSCKTLGEAMYKLAEISNVLNGGPYNMVREADGQIMYVMDDSSFPYVLTDQNFLFFGIEVVLMVLHGTWTYLANRDEPLPTPQVSIKRSAESSARHLRFWQGRIRHQSQNYILSYDESVRDIPLNPPEGGFSLHDMFRSIAHMVDAPYSEAMQLGYMRQRVRRELLNACEKDQQQVAEDLGVSVATMRRRLKEEGSSFREVRQEALEALAIKFLEAGFHPNDVAEKLGFSDLRSFSRAFKAWHNMTPSEYAASNKSKPGQ